MSKAAPRPTLPPPCSACRELRNWWRDPITGAVERCPYCDRGRMLKEGLGRKWRRKARPEQAPAFDGRMASTGERT